MNYTARYLGKINGKRVYRYWVNFRSTDIMSRDFNYIEGCVAVTSTSAADAIEYVRDEGEWTDPVELWTHGPKGGRTERFSGYEDIIFRTMLKDNRLKHSQLSIPLEVVDAG